MNIDKLLDCIESSDDTKIRLFKIYICNYIYEFKKTYRTIIINDETIDFIDGTQFEINTKKTLETLIDEFELNIETYRENRKNVIITLDENKLKYEKYFEELSKEILNKYFKIKILNFKMEKRDKDYNNIFFYIDFYCNDRMMSLGSFRISFIELYNNYEFIYDNLKKLVIEKVEAYIKLQIETEYLQIIKPINITEIMFVDTAYSIVRLNSSRTWKRTMEVSKNVFFEEAYYQKAKVGLEEYVNGENLRVFVQGIIRKYNIIRKPIPKSYDLEKAIIDDSYDLDIIKNMEIFRNDVEEKVKYFNDLKLQIELKDIHNYKLLNYYDLYKVEDFKYEEDNYVIYNCKIDHELFHIAFKNGTRTFLTFLELQKVIGYKYILINKNCNIDDKEYWKKISRLPLDIIQMRSLKDKLNWGEISRHKTLTFDMMIEFVDYFDWKYLLKARKFRQKELEQLTLFLGWDIISEFSRNEHFLVHNLENINMEKILKNPTLKYLHDITNTLMNSK